MKIRVEIFFHTYFVYLLLLVCVWVVGSGVRVFCSYLYLCLCKRWMISKCACVRMYVCVLCIITKEWMRIKIQKRIYWKSAGERVRRRKNVSPEKEKFTDWNAFMSNHESVSFLVFFFLLLLFTVSIHLCYPHFTLDINNVKFKVDLLIIVYVIWFGECENR